MLQAAKPGQLLTGSAGWFKRGLREAGNRWVARRDRPTPEFVGYFPNFGVILSGWRLRVRVDDETPEGPNRVPPAGPGSAGGRARAGRGDSVVAVFLRAAALLPLLGAGATACTTVDLGPDFQFADVVYDEGYFYCRVEPVLVELRCGAGDPARGDASGGCHSNVTPFRLVEHPAGAALTLGVFLGTLSLRRPGRDATTTNPGHG